MCGLRIHQALTVQTIEDRLQQACPQLTLEAQQTEQPSPHKALPKKMTRIQVIQQLLAKQQRKSRMNLIWTSIGSRKLRATFDVAKVAVVYTRGSTKQHSTPSSKVPVWTKHMISPMKRIQATTYGRKVTK